MKKLIKFFVYVAIVAIICFVLVKRINIFGPGITRLDKVDGIVVVPTMSDKIATDTAWCGTFQLVWNDMKNTFIIDENDISNNTNMIKNLNKSDFDESMISQDYYYKKYGERTLELKAEIENGIREKFNQESDILDGLDWSANPGDNKYIFYTMLYRKFEYLNAFKELENGKFGENYDNVRYFGVINHGDDSIKRQVEVLYYNSQNDFAVIVNTKSNDEVIFCKNPKGRNFNEIYSDMNKCAEEYKGEKLLKDVDEFKAPYIEFDELRKYYELKGTRIDISDSESIYIDEAVQTIRFSLDEKGGEIKSEAALLTANSAIEHTKKEKPRYFYVDDTFALFLREKGRAKPYFAARIEDITKYQ